MSRHTPTPQIDARPGTVAAGNQADSNPRVLVAVVTYNEIENVPIFFDRLRNTLPQADILLLDDQSPDGTGHWCDVQALADPKVSCIHRPGKQGLGTAVIRVMQYAVEHDYDGLVCLDVDLSHPPEEIPRLLDSWLREGTMNTVVIASRYVRGGDIQGWPLRRHLMSRAINLYTRVLLGMPMKDCSGSFRVYPVQLLKQIDFNELLSPGYSFFEEILYRLKRKGAKFVEVPFTFVERQHGLSKINMWEAAKAVWTIFRLAIGRTLGSP